MTCFCLNLKKRSSNLIYNANVLLCQLLSATFIVKYIIQIYNLLKKMNACYVITSNPSSKYQIKIVFDVLLALEWVKYLSSGIAAAYFFFC